jgi:hypothetical protein
MKYAYNNNMYVHVGAKQLLASKSLSMIGYIDHYFETEQQY